MPAPKEPDRVSKAKWLKGLAKVRPEVAVPGYWDALEQNCGLWTGEVAAGPLWTEAKKRLDVWRHEYRRMAGEALLAKEGLPGFLAKSQARAKDKLYQMHLDDPETELFPRDGAPIPTINDLVRTRISCRFLDGVEFLAVKLVDLAQEIGCLHEHTREGRLEGYYAQHVVFEEHVHFRRGGAVTSGVIRCEVQLATLLATRIWESSHPVYQMSREIEEEPADWQWNPKDPRFVSTELGHMIHLADGLLVRLREANRSRRTEGQRNDS